MNTITPMRARLLVSSMLATALVGAAGAASAQTSPPATATPPQPAASQPTEGPGAGASANAQPSTVENVVVTGTLVRQPNLTSQAPITTVNSQEFKLQGTTQVESLLDNLPQFVAAQNQSVSNGSSGTATINLRNLGPSRTLVLVDGTRLQPGDPNTGSAADLNNIPAALVDRVDVLTGGASTTYGSDAVAGVVNFILKKNFEGVQIDTQYSFYNHQQGSDVAQSALSANGIAKPGDVSGDGQTWDVSMLLGANSPDDKGNVTFYATYRNLQPVLQSSRDFSACALATDFTSSLYCAGSSNSAYGRFDNTAAGGSYTNTAPGVFGKYNSSYAFNYGPYNYIQRADDRYNAGAFAHYKINDMVEVYGNFMFTDDQSVAQIAPSGLFRGTGPNGQSTFSIPCNNPLLSAQQATILCGANAGSATATYNGTVGYRFINLPRQDNLRHTDYRFQVGARGDLGAGWNYDAYLQYGVTLLNENYQNDVSVSRVQNALNVVQTANGPACTIGGSCVPLNIFTPLSQGLTQAQLNYVSVPGFQSAQEDERIAHIQVSGDLGQYGLKSPLAADGIGVAFGAEYREESLTYKTDAEFSSGDLAGQGGPRIGTSGTFDTYELFGEANVPILSGLPLAERLDLDLAYRYSDYSTVGEVDTYKATFTYSPIHDLRIRGGYNRAVRAPNVVELFAPTSIALGSFVDPCAVTDNGGRPTATAAQCANTGLSLAQYNAGVAQCPSGQCSILSGGSTNLQSERANTYTLGFVYQPHYLRGFSISVDAFDINVNGVIEAGLPSTTILTQCLAGNQFYCAQIHRDPTTGILFGSQGYVSATNVNAGVLRTKGIDIDANYTTRLSNLHLPDYGSVTLSMIGTYTGEYYFKPVPGQEGYDCIGLYGPTCGQPQSRWKHQVRVTWNSPWNAQFSAQWRFMSGTRLDIERANVNLFQGEDPVDASIGDYNYLDLAATWKVRDGLALRVGVNNVLDNDPPVLDSTNVPVSSPGNFGNGNTFPGVFDSLGRYIFMGLTANF